MDIVFERGVALYVSSKSHLVIKLNGGKTPLNTINITIM